MAAALFLPRPSEAACVAAPGQEAWPVFYTSSAPVYCGDGTNWNAIPTGGGTPAPSNGYVQFNNSNAFGGDSNLFWDNTNKRLGIGTATPAVPLHIKSAGTSVLRLETGGTGQWAEYNVMQSDAASGQKYWSFGMRGDNQSFFIRTLDDAYTNPAYMLNITRAGSVGIGTTSPLALLHIEKNQAAETGLFINNTDAAGYSSVRLGPSDRAANGDAMFFAGTTSGIRAGNRALVLQTGSASAERVRIDTAGNVGIGTAAPAASAVLDLTSTAKGFLPPRMTSSQRDLIGTPATGLTIFNTTNSQLEFYNGTSWNGIGSMTAGSILAFAASACPSGWTEYTAARGRFLRGIDPSGSTTVDPSGTRAPGSAQADAFQGHFHNSSAMNATNTRPVGGGVQESATAGTATGAPIADGVNGTPRTSSETRPVNVAVIFCQYTGSGNVSATATVSGTANYVAKFTGAQAVGNSQIFDNGTNVGIGTISPASKLDVNGTVTATQYSGLAAASNFQRIIAQVSGAAGGTVTANCPAGYTIISWGLITDQRTQGGTGGWNNGGTLYCTAAANGVTVMLTNYTGTPSTLVECQGLCARN